MQVASVVIPASTSLAGVGLLASSNTWTAQNTFAAGTITTSQPLTVTQTWNAAGVTFKGVLINCTSTASAAASVIFDVQLAGSTVLKVDKSGDTTITNILTCGKNLAVNRQVVCGYFFACTQQAMTDGATITPNSAAGELRVTLGGNRTMAAPASATDSQVLRMRIKQDATGTRILTWNAIYRFTGGVAPTLSTAANAIDYITFIYNLADTKWEELSRSLNVA